jgi:hypothetical protein
MRYDIGPGVMLVVGKHYFVLLGQEYGACKEESREKEREEEGGGEVCSSLGKPRN